MPQPKKPTATSRRSTSPATGTGAAAKKAPARKPAAAKKAPAAKAAAPAAKAAPAKTPTPSGTPVRRGSATPTRKAVGTPVRRPVAQAAPGDDAAAVLRDEALRSNIAQLRDLLAGGVVLSAQRVQEAMDDAVSRGRLTKDDAEQLAQGLVSAGRQQAFDVLAQVDRMLDRGRNDLDEAARKVRDTAARSSDKAIRSADKVRRAAKIGAFPILRYDDLTAAAISERLADLAPADLRKVRDYEARNANRKSVLAAVDKALG